MKRDIYQGWVSPALTHFKEGFMSKWGLSEYTDTDKPCVFFGVYIEEDVQIIKEHKGTGVVIFTNAMGNGYLKRFKGHDNLVIKDNPWLDRIEGIRYKNYVDIEIKDYSMFKPNKLGNKIYCYVGSGNAKSETKHGWAIARELDLPYEILFGIRKYSIEELKEKFYDTCFVNLNLSVDGGGGLTSVRELGHMGRKTIMNTKRNYDCIIPYKDHEDIIRIINKEAEKIGTIQPPITGGFSNTGSEWLCSEFWVK